MSSSSKPIDTRRLYQQVADQIRAVIESGRFPPGTRLPPERELAMQLGVSRPSLREALIALEIDGRVEIRMGSGVYVCSAPTAPQAEAAASLGDSPFELMQARSVLEVAIITVAAARVHKQGLRRIKDCIESMRQEIHRGRSPIEADKRFHVAIAEMTENATLARLVGELFDGRHSPISSRMSRQTENAQTWEAALAEHEAIYLALEARNPLEASAKMFNHLQSSQERWIGTSSPIADN